MSTRDSASGNGQRSRPLGDALSAALGEPSPEVRRLRYARSNVAFRVADGSESVTLLLDRASPEVDTSGPDAEIEIELTSEQAQALADGELSLGVAIARREVTSRGPVRRYLEVDPILRGLLADAACRNGRTRPGPRAQPGHADGAVGRSIDPDLLAIEVQAVEKAFGSHQVLAGLDLDIPEGVVAAVLGPSGTGKSVLLQHINGLMRPDAGEVLVRGRKLSKMSRADLLALRRQMGVLFQDGALLGTMSVYDNTAFPLRQHTDLREAEIREVVMAHLDEVGLGSAAGKMPNELSGGMRKRAGLARALVLEPGILLCDEPDSGLDPVRTALLADLLLQVHERSGGTIVIVTHDVKLARYVADHMSLIWRGKVVASGFSDDVMNTDDQFARQFLSGESAGPLGMD